MARFEARVFNTGMTVYAVFCEFVSNEGNLCLVSGLRYKVCGSGFCMKWFVNCRSPKSVICIYIMY